MQSAIASPIQETLPDGKTYTFTKIGINQWAAFAEWVNIQEGRRRSHICEMTELMNAAMTFQGARWMVCHSMQEYHSGTKLEDVGNLFESTEAVIKMVSEIMDAPEPEEGDESDPQEDQPSP